MPFYRVVRSAVHLSRDDALDEADGVVDDPVDLKRTDSTFTCSTFQGHVQNVQCCAYTFSNDGMLEKYLKKRDSNLIQYEGSLLSYLANLALNALASLHRPYLQSSYYDTFIRNLRALEIVNNFWLIVKCTRAFLK